MPDAGVPVSRAAEAAAFCASAGWGGALRAFLAGDASARRYERLTRPDGRTAVLMDAPPGSGEDIAAFLRIGLHLRGLGLSAPAVYAEDAEAGFLLLEDLGDDLFARLLVVDPSCEAELYGAATDVLLVLQANPPLPGLPVYDSAAMADAVAPAVTAYRFALTGSRDDPAPLSAAVRRCLDALPSVSPTMILRDYHAENLLWLPGRAGTSRVGVLDYQLAMLGHPAFDLVSLLQDARRDVSTVIEAQQVDRFARASGFELEEFYAAYHAIGAQRHLRILGVFARLGLEHGKTAYLDYVPRVWRDLQRDLAHSVCSSLSKAVSEYLPPPDIVRLKEACARRP